MSGLHSNKLTETLLICIQENYLTRELYKMLLLAFFSLSYVNCLTRLWEDVKFHGETLRAILFIIPI